MKKLLTLILLLGLLLSNISGVSGDNSVAQYTPTDAQAEALEILESLGVADAEDYADGNIFIKRGMLAKLAIRMYSITDVEKQSTGFTDVTEENKLSGYIYMAKNMGIVNGTGNGKFSPEAYASYEQIIKVMISVLGRENQAASYGGYSGGYMSAATRLGLLKHFWVEDKSKITIYEVAPLILDVLETKIEDPLNPVDSNEYKDTLLHRYFDTTKHIATVNADYYISRNGVSTDSPSKLVFGDMEVWTKDYIPDLVGERVSAYLKNVGTDDCTLVWYKKAYADSKIVIDSDDLLTETNASQIRYKDANTSRSASISGAAVIKNGKLLTPATDADFNITNGTITLISSQGSSYDTVLIDEYQDIVVRSLYDDGETVGVKNNYTDVDGNLTNKIVIDTEKSTEPKILLKNWDNKKIAPADVEEDDILSVAISDKLIKIVRSDRCVSGAITAIGEDCVIISEEEIKTDFSVLNTDRSLKLNLDAIYSLNFRGKLVWIGDVEELGTNASQYGYVVAANITRGTKAVTQLKIFNQSGKMQVYDLAEKIIFNNSSKKNSNVVLMINSPLIENENLKRQLVKFKLNSNGEIRELSTAQDNSTDYMDDETRRETFTIDYKARLDESGKPIDENLIGSPAYMIAGKYLIRNETFIFSIPSTYDGSDDEELSIKKLTDLAHSDDFPDLVLYDVDPKSHVIGAFIDSRDAFTTARVNAMSGVVARKGMCRDVDDNYINFLDIYNNKGNLVRYTMQDDVDAEMHRANTDGSNDNIFTKNGINYIKVSDLKVGDVVQFELKGDTEITALSVLLRNETPQVIEKAFSGINKDTNIPKQATLTENNNYFGLLTGYGLVQKLSDYGFTMTLPFNNNGDTAERIQFFDSTLLLLYDSQTKEVKKIVPEEIREGEDHAFIHRASRKQLLTVIYR